MKLNKKNMVVISFMLFSLFFGAGNLIFPPFLGQNAGGTYVYCDGWFFINSGCIASAWCHCCC
ncbi:branched-chain amino acid transport system II carrier protein [Holdemanella biformis]|nr:branched-chain amino acid transport system II carrier protein [Holdemanella biformis]MBV3415690.1 branched-chain amino acid transport system II carrier protein [Holdemanella biformis]